MNQMHFPLVQNSVGPDIPSIEIANAANQVLKDQISLSKEDLTRETARLFSFSKVGSIVDIAMRQGIQLAIANRYAIEQNGELFVFEY
ncbi:MAG: hypothetical protein ABI091_08905 [Ferruginibacter sp.]